MKRSGDHYFVVKRTCKRVNGRNVPIELGTIGKIVDGKYVAIRQEPAPKGIAIKDYGAIRLCMTCSTKMLGTMVNVWGVAAAKEIYALALLRAAYPGLSGEEVKMRYETSFVSEEMPGLTLTEDAIGRFLEETGKAGTQIKAFMECCTAFYGKELLFWGQNPCIGLLKSDSRLIGKYGMSAPKERLVVEDGLTIRSKKVETKSGKYLYAFDDGTGLHVFKSASDLEPATVYQAYNFQQEVQALFSKNLLERSQAGQSEPLVLAASLIDYVTLLIANQVNRRLMTTKLANKHSYIQIIKNLSNYKKVRINNKWQTGSMPESVEKTVENLAL